MIPVIPKLAPTVYAEVPGYRVGNRFFPAATRLSPGQIYSSATHRHQNLQGMTARADYAAQLMPTVNMVVRPVVGSLTQPVNHYQYHLWDYAKWYWKNMRFSLPEQDYSQVHNQMGKQLPGQPMMMQPQPRFTKVLNAPRYNTLPSALTPTANKFGEQIAAQAKGQSAAGQGAIVRRRFVNSAPFKAIGPEFHG